MYKNFYSYLMFLPFLFLFTKNAFSDSKLETATFAGGCFWCMETPFESLKGVLDVVSGYTGGTGAHPTYEDYAQKGHVEVIQITYDPSRVRYEQILELFWRQIDPTDPGGQFGDRGPHYRTAIFYNSEEQKRLAEQSKKNFSKSGIFKKPIVTEIIKAATFYPAEEYHQNYHAKNPDQYDSYRSHSGRDQFLKKAWKGVPPGQAIVCELPPGKIQLTPLQNKVIFQSGTEPPFQNEYWNNKKEGIYVDKVSGKPLFSSKDKFDSGTGWPSFTKPINPDNIIEKDDKSLFIKRTEVRGKHGNTHLGHVFDDGPDPTGLRFCINSASLRFIPKEDLEKEGFGEYKKLFE